MSVTSKRCIVCNELTFSNSDFCSAYCQDQHNELMENIADANRFENMSEEEWESLIDSEPPYLDDYYMPYKREWIE